MSKMISYIRLGWSNLSGKYNKIIVMKTKHFYQMMMSVLMASMLAMTSCSKNTDLLNTVPVTSAQVVTIDLYKLFTEMGCSEVDGILMLSSDLETILNKTGQDVSDEFKLLLSSNAIDMHQVVAFAENGKPVVTFRVNDAKVLVDALSAEKIDSAQG
ncbi:MAG: hypothetical protein IJZ17_03220, partial [Muribaculaceae bacterium]|nr:hypothetical protein [Muribaculaceae bacterium]